MALKIMLATDFKRSPIDEVMAIFFESSNKKDFQTERAKRDFFEVWCGQYLSKWPDWFFILCDEEKVLAYLAVCPNSLNNLVDLHPSLQIFKDYFEKFPAHLHINALSSCRGKGLGSMLMESAFRKLNQVKICGIHLVTSPSARNVSFYQKNGFSFSQKRPFNGVDLLFLGKELG